MEAIRTPFGTVTIRACPLDDDSVMPLHAATVVLSPDEVARADAFRFPRDQARFIRARAFLRGALSQELACPADRIVFASTANGKPRLARGGPAFNLSHGGGWAVIALSDTAAVGIDAEPADRFADQGDSTIDDLADACLQPHERAGLDASPDRRTRFLDYWTAKEARMKVTGEGLALAPRRIGLDLREGLPAGYLTPPEPPVCLIRLSLPGLVAALAVGPRVIHLGSSG